MSQDIRLAVVGYGRGGGLFELAADGFEGILPTAVCDRMPEAFDRARKTFPDIATYESCDEMLDRGDIDALLVATPATCHAEFAIKALKKNIHVLSEIPAIASVEEGQALWDTHLKSKALYMAGANPNFWGFVDTAVDLKEKGLFGEPVYVEASYIHDVTRKTRRTEWRNTYEPIRYCTHSLGPVLRLVEEDLEWVSCFDTGSHIHKVEGQHDAMAALFRTPSNVVVRLLVSFVNYYCGGRHHYRFMTTKGCFERSPAYRTFRKEPAEGPRTLFYTKDLPVFNNWTELPIGDMPLAYAGNPKAAGHGGADYAMLDAFFMAIRQGLPSPVSVKEALRMTLPGIYAAESARKGGELTRIRYPWSKD